MFESAGHTQRHKDTKTHTPTVDLRLVLDVLCAISITQRVHCLVVVVVCRAKVCHLKRKMGVIVAHSDKRVDDDENEV